MKQRKQFVGAPPLVTRVRDAQRRVKALERAGTSLYNTLTIVEVDGYKHKPQPIVPTTTTKPHVVPTVTTGFFIYPVDSTDPYATQEMWTEV